MNAIETAGAGVTKQTQLQSVPHVSMESKKPRSMFRLPKIKIVDIAKSAGVETFLVFLFLLKQFRQQN